MRHFSRSFFGEFFHSSNHPTRASKLPNCWSLATEFTSWKNETFFTLFFGKFFHSSNHPTRASKLPNCWSLAAEFIYWKNDIFHVVFSANFFTVSIIPQECQSYQIIGLWPLNLFLEIMRHFLRCFFGFSQFQSSHKSVKATKLLVFHRRIYFLKKWNFICVVFHCFASICKNKKYIELNWIHALKIIFG